MFIYNYIHLWKNVNSPDETNPDSGYTVDGRLCLCEMMFMLSTNASH